MYVVIRSKGRNWEVAEDYFAKRSFNTLVSSFIHLCARATSEFTVLIDCVWLRSEQSVCELSDLSFL